MIHSEAQHPPPRLCLQGIIDLVLATDMKQHVALTSAFTMMVTTVNAARGMSTSQVPGRMWDAGAMLSPIQSG